MRIEGISEVSALQPTGNAFEQHAPVRTATTQRTARPATNVPSRDTSGTNDTTGTAADAVVDVHDSADALAPRQEVEFKLPRRAVPIHNDQQGVVDRNGDGMISLSDLPFDYFQISRQASRKLITPPVPDIPF